MPELELSNCLFNWKPLTPSDIILLLTVFVAAFGPPIWKYRDNKNNRIFLRRTTIQLLENLKDDLKRIRDERNHDRGDRNIIIFNEISISEVSHYYFIFEDILMKNLTALKLPKKSSTVDLFDHYKKNIEVCKKISN